MKMEREIGNANETKEVFVNFPSDNGPGRCGGLMTLVKWSPRRRWWRFR
jgi:hypothetical protein